jgi:hypothetical protein
VSCSQCGSGEYQLVDEHTGEIVCCYCRNRWVVQELAKKTETEKFLEKQAKQPRVIQVNTTETDEKLMGMLTSIAGSSGRSILSSITYPFRRFFNAVGRAVTTILVLVGIAAIVLAVLYFLGYIG